jgi:aryl-alcohol dehydrogenase-like predicted oxidoreductase
MNDESPSPATSRRSFLKTSLAAPLAYALASGVNLQAQTSALPSSSTTPVLPRRKLGKNGPEVTMISLGGMMSALSPQYLDIAWSMGIRYFDTADCYLKGQSEKIIGQWLAKYPERRKEIFLVSKDHPRKGPEEMLQMVDRRLAALGTSYLDLFFIHGIGGRDYGPQSLDWPKSPEFKKVIEKLKSSGKCKMVGFSCHEGNVASYMQAAADGGFVDAIMLGYEFPKLIKGSDKYDEALDKSLDACHQAGIGLVAMKTMRPVGEVPKRVPEFDKIGLTTHQALLHAVYSDPRISAVCSMIANVEQMEMNTSAARSFKAPLKLAQLEALSKLTAEYRRTMCTGCPACNSHGASTEFAFQDIARFVTYYEQDGLLEARDFFHALPASARDFSRVDLAALRDACNFGTDYPEIMRRAQRYFI